MPTKRAGSGRASTPPAPAVTPAVLPPSAEVGSGPAPERSTGGSTLRWAIRLLQVEAAALALWTFVSIWLTLASNHTTVGSAIADVVFWALCALVLFALARALNLKKSLARGPAIVIEMLLIPIGYYMIAGGLPWLGIPSMIIGLLGSGLLLAPSTREALGLTNGTPIS